MDRSVDCVTAILSIAVTTINAAASAAVSNNLVAIGRAGDDIPRNRLLRAVKIDVAAAAVVSNSVVAIGRAGIHTLNNMSTLNVMQLLILMALNIIAVQGFML